jgi:hypothetical protein
LAGKNFGKQAIFKAISIRDRHCIKGFGDEKWATKYTKAHFKNRRGFRHKSLFLSGARKINPHVNFYLKY